MADLSTLTTWLQEAEQAKQDLIVGNRVETLLSVNQSHVRYALADMDALDRQIQSLRDQIYRLENPSSCGPRAPVRFYF